MKVILVIWLATNLLLACNSPNNKENREASDTSIVIQKPSEPGLNNGAKWKADSTTISNVALLQGIVSNARKETPGDYNQTATQVEAGLNKMIIECKMTGRDHDALHRWLEPIIEKTKELKAATTTEKAAATFNEIEKQINGFTQYFE